MMLYLILLVVFLVCSFVSCYILFVLGYKAGRREQSRTDWMNSYNVIRHASLNIKGSDHIKIEETLKLLSSISDEIKRVTLRYSDN